MGSQRVRQLSDFRFHFQSTHCEMPGWMNHKLESRSPGETSTMIVQKVARSGVDVFCLVSESRSVVSDSLQPHGLYSPRNSRLEYWSGWPFSSPGDLPNPGIKPKSPTLPADSLPAEPQRKPKNTGVGSLSLLQQIFPTQELNWGLLHCRQILNQLSLPGILTSNLWFVESFTC